MINVAMLRKAVEWVEEQDHLDPKTREWAQGRWFTHRDCGTAYCVAGFVALSAGWVSVDDNDLLVTLDGRVVAVDVAAQEVLGVTTLDGHRLFLATNTARDIREVAESIAGVEL